MKKEKEELFRFVPEDISSLANKYRNMDELISALSILDSYLTCAQSQVRRALKEANNQW